jgi:hypothetical protein
MCVFLAAWHLLQENSVVVQQGLVVRAELEGSLEVLLGLLRLIQLLKGNCPGVVGLGGRVQGQRGCEVLDCLLEEAHLLIGVTAVVVEIWLARVQLDGLGEVRDGQPELPQPVIRNGPVVICKGTALVQLDGQRVIPDGLLVFAQLIVREASVEQGLEVTGVLLQGPGV